jgi:hypothetical protein
VCAWKKIILQFQKATVESPISFQLVSNVLNRKVYPALQLIMVHLNKMDKTNSMSSSEKELPNETSADISAIRSSQPGFEKKMADMLGCLLKCFIKVVT